MTAPRPPIDEDAAVVLLEALDAAGYDFTTVTPETHRRVVARPAMARARTLRGAFGWSLPFADGALPEHIVRLAAEARLLRDAPGGLRRIDARASRVCGRLFLHSAFPTTDEDSVFLGPDTARFCRLIEAELGRARHVHRIVDIGAGAGVGGIVAGRLAPHARVELVDVNARALAHARVNARANDIAAETYASSSVGNVVPGIDLALANPPFIIDEDGPTYRAGGDMHGAQLSLEWALDAAAKLAPGGRVLLYTGSAVVDGRHELHEALIRELGEARVRWQELDPDIFGEELSKPAYADVERIAAVGVVIS